METSNVTATAPPTEEEEVKEQPRTSLNGCWILDKSQGVWSMRGYLEAMNANELAISVHERANRNTTPFTPLS